MEYNYSGKNNRKLLLIFLGWSCDGLSAEQLSVDGYDKLSMYDYRSLDVDIDHILSLYDSVVVVGWSFGVFAADKCDFCRDMISLSIAVNGTGMPVSDKYGITPKIFDFTLRNIKRRGIGEFNVRMCGDDISMFREPCREFSDQCIELETLGNAARKLEDGREWDYSIIGSLDIIFPPENMRKYWDKKSKFAPLTVPIPHYPFGDIGIQEITNIIESQFEDTPRDK